jgi:hypothetical protein
VYGHVGIPCFLRIHGKGIYGLKTLRKGTSKMRLDKWEAKTRTEQTKLGTNFR